MARIALCQNVATEYMGFMYISAVLKEAGHIVECFIERLNEDSLIKELKDFVPDIVGFSVLTPSRPWTLRVARRIKDEIGALTVLGNVEAMLNPDIIEEPGVDIVCLGEGEMPMKELASCVDEGRDYSKIIGFWVKTADHIVKNRLPKKLLDLNTLPFQDRSIYDKYRMFRRSSYLRILNGRGCPFHCSFCLNPVVRRHLGFTQYIRKRSPELVIEEIEYLIGCRKERVNYIFFVDEVMWVSNRWLRQFMALYKERIGIPFLGNFRHGPIEESDIRMLKQAGAHAFVLAIESGSEQQRLELMKKNVSDESLLRVAAMLHKYGIKIITSCFFGIPGDTVKDHVERLEFYRRIKPAYLWTTFFAPYPHLELTATPMVQAVMPKNKEYSQTLHHDMYLEVRDKERLIRLKKVYYLCLRFRRLSRTLVWLTKFNIPLLFDILFSAHFFWYALEFERVSIRHLLEHLKMFVIRPFVRKKKCVGDSPAEFS